ncbi:MAG: hypothetical protein ACO1O6_03510 [Bacteroidota bacterium]
MFNWFRKKDKKKPAASIQKVEMKPLDYHPKVILAWAKALEGNKEISGWLRDNGFEELVFANAAIHLKNEARSWLLNNGYPHLMAMIHGAEGDEKAQKWLLANDFEILYHIALAVENEQESWKWLKQNATQDLFILAQTIKIIKDQIEENHNDVHSFGRD